jgi:hypothetical protein
MKSLDQIEARTPIGSLPFAISTSGSYYLTGNLTFTAPTGDAIAISASDVTLDLNGFTLKSVAAVTGTALSISSGTANVTVKNGNIAGNSTVAITGTPPSRTWTTTPAGFQHGIEDNSTAAHFVDLSIRGCRSQGIFSYSPGQAIVERVSSVSNGTAMFVESGIIIGCTARGNAVGGINAPNGSVSSSVAISNGGNGISAAGGNIANCTSAGNANDGVDQAVATRTAIPGSAVTPLAGPHFTITQPGSYYLTGNITVSSDDAIRISSDDVSLDLNGFTIRSTFPGAGDTAVRPMGTRTRLTVRNGSIVSGSTVTAAGVISYAGFFRGIGGGNGQFTQAVVTDVNVTGVGGNGIILAAQGIVERCTVRECGTGIVVNGGGIVRNCSAQNCANSGISCNDNSSAIFCHASRTWAGSAGFANLAIGCTGTWGLSQKHLGTP